MSTFSMRLSARLTQPLLCGLLAFGPVSIPVPVMAEQAPDYFTAFESLNMTRDEAGVLVVEMHSDGGSFTFSATDHREFVEAFYRIGRDRDNQIVILTGAGGDWMPGVDFASFGDVSDARNWSAVHDEGTQILENIANIRVPMICAVEGRAHVHSEYCLLANIIVAAESATFTDAPHFAGGIVPGDGIFQTWSYMAGPGRAQNFLLNPTPISAQTAMDWGVVTHITPDGGALEHAQELAETYLQAPEITRRNTRIHFIQPIKERIIGEVGYGLSLEGASANAFVLDLQERQN